MRAYDVTPQRITPLLTQAGQDFEERIEHQIRQKFRGINSSPTAHLKARTIRPTRLLISVRHSPESIISPRTVLRDKGPKLPAGVCP